MRKLYTTCEPARRTVGRVGSLENNENEETPRDPHTRGGSEKGAPSRGVFDALKTCVLLATSIVFIVLYIVSRSQKNLRRTPKIKESGHRLCQ